MTTVAERNERMNRILSGLQAVVMWVQGESNKTPSLHDHDGDSVAILPEYLVELLDKLSDEDAGTVLEGIADIAETESRRSFADGHKVGHQTAVAQVHEFLGINRICDALSAVVEAEGG